jgi:hypothetical protein
MVTIFIVILKNMAEGGEREAEIRGVSRFKV